MSHRREHITNLPTNWSELASPDLDSIVHIWTEQKDRLRERDAIRAFNDRLAREWAIETGIIENVYQIDRGVTLLLIEKGLDAALIPYGASDRPAEEIVQIVKDHQSALEGLFAFVKQNRMLSKSYVCELHQVITAHHAMVPAKDTLGNLREVALLRGQFKKMPNNPMVPGKGLHEYCPPEQVESEMDQLLAWHGEHVAAGVTAEVEAARFHHRFTQIHPFQDGNGRVARALASLVLIKGGYFPLLVTRDERSEYLESLAAADQSDLAPLVALFTRIQKKCFLPALSLSHDIIKERNGLDAVVAAAIERLSTHRHEEETRQKKVFDISRLLEAQAHSKCRQIAETLHVKLQMVDSHYTATARRSEPSTEHWYRFQVVQTARKLEYFAASRTYRAWVGIRIQEERITNIVLSFHCVGTEFVGLMAVSAFEEYRELRSSDEKDDVETGAVDGPHVVCRQPFEFSYLDAPDAVKRRFTDWLTEAITLALDQWRRQL
jgi:Fic family protein